MWKNSGAGGAGGAGGGARAGVRGLEVKGRENGMRDSGARAESEGGEGIDAAVFV